MLDREEDATQPLPWTWARHSARTRRVALSVRGGVRTLPAQYLRSLNRSDVAGEILLAPFLD